jgi:uncharacterized protein (TIGR02147 family)
MTAAQTEITHILQKRLGELMEKNPQFSLRALAKRLKVSPSHLSRVMRGQKNFSHQSTLRLAHELDLDREQTERILKELSAARTQRKESPLLAERDERTHRVMAFETFRLVAEWYHFPLLELIRTKGFRHEEAWIAKRLGLAPSVVATALDRLEKLGFIKRAAGKIHLREAEMLKTPDDIRDIAIRKHHTQMLAKAAEALEVDPLMREFQALNLGVDPSEMNEAKKAIREFVKSFNKKFSKDRGHEVYQLNVQFFSLTKDVK